jgi:Domain of unknown function (DUF4386)
MTPRTAEPSPLRRARVAGFLYLSLGLFAPFTLLYVPSRLIVPGDAATTANNILANESLFRLGIVSALVTSIVNILVVLALYQLLKPVNKNMAWLMVIFLLVAIPIGMLNELNQLAILHLLHGPDHGTGFTAEQLQAQVSLFLNLHTDGLNIAGIFYGLWLIPMGYLVFTSGFLPRILGILLLIGGFGYLIQSFAALLFPDLNVNIVLLTDWGELLFPLWLVIRGVNVERWEKRARELA